MGSPPALGVGEVLASPHHKNLAGYETLDKASDLLSSSLLFKKYKWTTKIYRTIILFVLCWRETCYLTLEEKHRLREGVLLEDLGIDMTFSVTMCLKENWIAVYRLFIWPVIGLAL